MLRWITSRYGDLVPIAVFLTVLGGVYVIDRQQSVEPLAQQRVVEDQATRKAELIADQIELAIDERISARTAAALRFTSIEDSVSQRTFAAALDTVTAGFAGLIGISAVYPDGTILRGTNSLLGMPGAQPHLDTILGNPFKRAQATRKIAASGVVQVGREQRVFIFDPVTRPDSQIAGYLVSELDPQAVVQVAEAAAQDSAAGTIWSVLGPTRESISTRAVPLGWRTVDRPVRVADTNWTVRFAYLPVDFRLFRTLRIATWVIGIVVALALSAILLFLRQTIGRQREEITRRQIAEEAARTSATEARERAREARELAVQLEAAQRASQRLSTSLDPDSVVELFLGGVAEILEADVASLYTFEEEGEVLVGRRRIVFRNVGEATERLKNEDIRQVRAPVALLPSIAEAVATGEPYVEIGQLVARGRPLAALSGSAAPAASTVTIPLQIAGHMVGVASWETYSEPREFSPASIAFAQAMAAPAAAALRTAELFSSLEEERGRVRREALRFAAVLDQMADGVVVVDGAGRVERYNKAAEELLGEGLGNLALEDWATTFNVATAEGRPVAPNEFPLLRALRGDRIRRATFIVRSSWGTERHLSCSAGPIITPDGQATGAAMVLRDVSDEHQYAEMLRHTNRELRRQAEVLEEVNRQLREATKAKDQFLAVMSHELRTPINAIMGYSDLLDLGVRGDLNAEQRAMVARVRETSRHLLGLINEVLDLAKIGAGRIDLVLVELEVHTIVERAAQQILPMATAKGLTLTTSALNNKPAYVIADETRLTQIIINLLSNAVKFTQTGGVTAHYGVVGDTVEIRVKDTGPGIPPELKERIFEEFYQVESGLSRSTGGTGLGLAIARRFAHLMGGDIRVVSEQGMGAEFIVTLPSAAYSEDRRPHGKLPVAVVLASPSRWQDASRRNCRAKRVWSRLLMRRASPRWPARSPLRRWYSTPRLRSWVPARAQRCCKRIRAPHGCAPASSRVTAKRWTRWISERFTRLPNPFRSNA
jgi:PAS domain S-box-containing protein